jgi:hypothetical protein
MTISFDSAYLSRGLRSLPEPAASVTMPYIVGRPVEASAATIEKEE